MTTRNKVVFGDTVLIDLTADTVTADKVLAPYTAHDASGAVITGTCDYDSATGDATVKVAEMLDGQTAYARGAKLTGIMPNNGGVSESIATADGYVPIAQGYHDGSGRVAIDETERAKLVADNIKEGVTVLGVTGTLAPASGVKAQAKTATPAKDAQTVLPDAGYDYLSQVDIAAIRYVEVANPAGGLSVTIG